VTILHTLCTHLPSALTNNDDSMAALCPTCGLRLPSQYQCFHHPTWSEEIGCSSCCPTAQISGSRQKLHYLTVRRRSAPRIVSRAAEGKRSKKQSRHPLRRGFLACTVEPFSLIGLNIVPRIDSLQLVFNLSIWNSANSSLKK
jgi:hypothetical protein